MYGKVYVAGKITGLTEEEFKRNFMQGVGLHNLSFPQFFKDLKNESR